MIEVVEQWAGEEGVRNSDTHWMPQESIYKAFAEWSLKQTSSVLWQSSFWRAMISAGLVRAEDKCSRVFQGRPIAGYPIRILGAGAVQAERAQRELEMHTAQVPATARPRLRL